MSIFSKIAAAIFAPITAAGVPRGADMAEVQIWGTELEQLISALVQAGSAAVFETRAQLFASLNYTANSMAWVVKDTTTAYNGIYRKNGTSGTGSWTRVANLPYSFVRMEDAGAGTANAIQLTSVIPTSSSVLRISNIVAANSGNVTISENGGTPKPLLTSSGNQISPGGLVAGAGIAYYEVAGNFRLLSDQASVAVLQAAEAALAAAQAAVDTLVDPQFSNLAAAEAFSPTIAPNYIRTAGYYAAGDMGGATYRKVADEPTHAGKFSITLDDNTTVVWYEIAEPVPSLLQLGADPTGSSSATGAIQAAIDIGRGLRVEQGTFKHGSATPLILPSGFGVSIAKGASIFQENTGNAGIFQIEAGTQNVSIVGPGGLYGPYTSSTPAPAPSYPDSNGAIRIVGAYDNVVAGVTVEGVEIFGWGDYGIFAENVSNSQFNKNHIHKIGRDGIRFYGVEGCQANFNTIHGISPGYGGSSPNLNVYGITFTRRADNVGSAYTVNPPSRNSQAIGNYIYDCPTWKALDSHGGIDLIFANNVIRDAYIGIGIDEGDTIGQEDASPRRITIIGNNIIRRDGLAGNAGINVSSSSVTNMGADIILDGNIVVGYGGSGAGAITVSYQRSPKVTNNHIFNADYYGIRFPGARSYGAFVAGNVHRDMTNCVAAVSVEDANTMLEMPSASFYRSTGTFIAMNFGSPSAGFGVSLGDAIQFFGTITKFTASSEGRIVGGAWLRRMVASGRVTSAGALSASHGIASVSKTGTGVYEVTLAEAMEAQNSIQPTVTRRGSTAGMISATPTSTTVITVYTFNSSGAATDAEFTIHVAGY